MNFLLVLLIYFNFFIYRFFDASVDIFTLAIQGYLLLCPLLIVYFVLQPSVDIKTVLSRLMERLSNYAASSAEVLPEFLQVEAFSKLNNAIGKVRLKNGWWYWNFDYLGPLFVFSSVEKAFNDIWCNNKFLLLNYVHILKPGNIILIDAGHRSTGWYAYFRSCGLIFISAYIHTPCPSWSAGLCRSSAGIPHSLNYFCMFKFVLLRIMKWKQLQELGRKFC